MTAHVLCPAWDERYPATLSKTILHGILRQRLGFDGVIITDNMEMRGVWGVFPPEELMLRSIEASCDVFIGGGGGIDGQHPQTDIQFQLIETLAALIDRRVISRERIEESQRRLRMVKQRYQIV